jgi:hypothetical protein
MFAKFRLESLKTGLGVHDGCEGNGFGYFLLWVWTDEKAFMNTVMKFMFTRNAVNFVTIWAIAAFGKGLCSMELVDTQISCGTRDTKQRDWESWAQM